MTNLNRFSKFRHRWKVDKLFNDTHIILLIHVAAMLLGDSVFRRTAPYTAREGDSTTHCTVRHRCGS